MAQLTLLHLLCIHVVTLSSTLHCQPAAAINHVTSTTKWLATITVHRNFRAGNRLRGGSERDFNAEEEAYLEDNTATEVKLLSKTQSWIRSQLEEILQQNPKPSVTAGLSDNIRNLYDHAEVQQTRDIVKTSML